MLSANLKYLRKRDGISQQVLSDALGVARATVAGYETGKAEPNVGLLCAMAQHFKVSLDALLTCDLRNGQFEVGNNPDFKVLAITVDRDQRQNVELVSTKAVAGYSEHFNDPEFISTLPKLKIPGLDEGTYRAFTVEGDSMLPVESGSLVVCRYIESLDDIKSGKTYVIVTDQGSIVYKRLYSNDLGLLAVSDNHDYDPYVITKQEIQELWEFRACVSFSDMTQSDVPIISRLDRILQKVEGL